jgi:predicted acyltransferase
LRCAILSYQSKLDSLCNLSLTALALLFAALLITKLNPQSESALAAENLFLRRQLALYLEREYIFAKEPEFTSQKSPQ